MTKYKIYGIFLLAVLMFPKNQAMTEESPGGSKSEEREVKSLFQLSALPLVKKAMQIYDDEFEINPTNAFKVMHDYLISRNMPNELFEEIYCQLIHNLDRLDIFIRKLVFDNKNETNLSLFFNLCHGAKISLVDKLIDILVHQDKNYPDISTESVERLIAEILKNYRDLEFYDPILLKLQDFIGRYTVYNFNLAAGTNEEKILKKIANKSRKVNMLTILKNIINDIVYKHYEGLKETVLPENKELFGPNFEKTKAGALSLLKAFNDNNKMEANDILNGLSKQEQDYILNYLVGQYFEENLDPYYVNRVIEFIEFLFPENQVYDKVLALYERLKAHYPESSKLIYSYVAAPEASPRVGILSSLNFYIIESKAEEIIEKLIEVNNSKDKNYQQVKGLVILDYKLFGLDFAAYLINEISQTISDSELLNDKEKISTLKLWKDLLQDLISNKELPEDFEDDLDFIDNLLFSIKIEEAH